MEKGCGPADSDEEEEKQRDMNLSGDTSEEVEKVIKKTYVGVKCDRLIREADDDEQAGDGEDLTEELKLNEIVGRRSAEIVDEP